MSVDATVDGADFIRTGQRLTCSSHELLATGCAVRRASRLGPSRRVSWTSSRSETRSSVTQSTVRSAVGSPSEMAPPSAAANVVNARHRRSANGSAGAIRASSRVRLVTRVSRWFTGNHLSRTLGSPTVLPCRPGHGCGHAFTARTVHRLLRRMGDEARALGSDDAGVVGVETVLEAPPDRLGASRDADLAVRGSDVGLDRVDAQVAAFRDLLVGEALSDQRQDFGLALRE